MSRAKEMVLKMRTSGSMMITMRTLLTMMKMKVVMKIRMMDERKRVNKQP